MFCRTQVLTDGVRYTTNFENGKLTLRISVGIFKYFLKIFHLIEIVMSQLKLGNCCQYCSIVCVLQHQRSEKKFISRISLILVQLSIEHFVIGSLNKCKLLDDK